MKQTAQRITLYFPILGLLLLLAGGAAFFVIRRWELLPNLLLAGGGLLLALFAVIHPDEVRTRLSGRRTRYGGGALLATLFFLAVSVLLYVVVYQNNDWRYDATAANTFTPLPETITLLESLEEPVHIIGFYGLQAVGQQETAESILQSMQAYTDLLTYEFLDPAENPLQAEQYELTFDSTLVFTQGSGENEAFAKASSLTDRDIHTALVRLINPTTKLAYFLTGHGERSPDDTGLNGLSTAVRLLQESGFTIEPLNLFVTGAVPEDATMVVLIDQQAPLSEDEVTALRQYLQGGGKLFLARDVLDTDGRTSAEEDGLRAMLQEDWGIRLRQDLIIDLTLAQAGQGSGVTFLGAEYGGSPITRELDQFGTIFDVARSIEVNEKEGVTAVPLVSTSEQAWGESDLESLVATGAYNPDEGEDALGPLAVGVSAQNQETGGQIVVFGDTNFLSNELITQGGNSLLFTNAMNWLVDDVIAIELTPRDDVNRQVIIPQTQLGLMQLVSICFAPGLLILLGVSVWASRRQRI